jgi:hypothetical protein
MPTKIAENLETDADAIAYEGWSGLSESNRHLNLGKVRELNLTRWNGGT